MNSKQLKKQLNDSGACKTAVDWLEGKSPSVAWRACQRGDWMLWYVWRIKTDRKLAVLAACDCVEPALKYIPDDEHRPRKAVATARAWCAGVATAEDCKNAANAAAAAANAAYAAYAKAAYAAANAAAYAAAAAANADAAYADAAADAAANAAYAAANAAYARKKSLRQSAAIVRRHIPYTVIRQALREQE